MKLIDKDALVVEIERQQRRCDILRQSNDVESRKTAAIQNGVYYYIISFLNTSEVKEVDLKKELELWMEVNADYTGHFNILEFAKYFFELGLKVNQKGE